MNKAIILLSGGLDSVVCLASVKDEYNEVLALFFDYSQKPFQNEFNAVKNISKYYAIDYKVIKLDWLGQLNNNKKLKSVWVPNRNALFVNIAACFAEALGYNDIIIGVNKEESINFIDNSPEFVNSINETLKYSVNSKVKLRAPLINMTKNDIVKKGIELNVPFQCIYSCYSGTQKHCGLCESCILLKNALKNSEKTDIMEKIFN